MSNMDENTNIIINLFEKYKKYICEISGDNEKDIFTNFYSKIDRAEIKNWVQNTFVNTSIKDDKKSIEYLNQGNEDFKVKKYVLALKNYNESLNYAKMNSENFALALAGRSAVFYEQNNYQSCIKDIQLCLTNYPHNIKYKLYQQLINCYIKLNNHKKAKENYEILKQYLSDDTLDIIESKKEQILHEFENIDDEDKTVDSAEENIDNKLPNLEENDNFAYASKFISLNYNKVKGRHVIANNDIQMGQILFIEKSYSFVPIWSEKTSENVHCYHCFKTTDCSIPCKNCKMQFCDFNCFDAAWTSYHRFECTGSCANFWQQVGVNYLATRILILGANSGFKNVFDVDKSNVERFGNPEDNYEYVCSLATNVDRMSVDDIFPHVVSAVIITTYLEEKTNFFDLLRDKNKDISANIVLITGSVLLRHILQVICNASTVESVDSQFYKTFNSTEQLMDNGLYFSGVGIYPSVSMMNHSCDANVSNFFINDYIIVKASTDIKKHDEIFNSYGYDCRTQVTVNRNKELLSQHYFACDCTGCTFPSKPEIFHEALLCKNCAGPCFTTADDIYVCVECSHEFNATNHFLYIRKAENLLEKYERSKNVECLKKCLELREKVFYKYNFCIYTTNLDLQTYYGQKGNIKLWWFHTQKSLDKDDELITGLKSAMNIRLCLLILLRYITSLNFQEENPIDEVTLLDMLAHAHVMFETMRAKFRLYYDERKINFNFIYELLQDAIAVCYSILRENLV